MNDKFDELAKGLAQSATRRAALTRFTPRLSRITLPALIAAINCLACARAGPAQQAYVKASNTDTLDGFGVSVATSGDTVVVGADSESSNATGVNGNQRDNSAQYAGAAYVLVRSGTNWTQQAYLKASNTASYQEFGSSVAISGDTVVVGAPNESSSAIAAGAVYIFVRHGTNWNQQAYLKASNSGTEDEFGFSVAVSGDTVVVGAHGESSRATGINGNQNDNSAQYAGAAYVFVRSGTNWTQQAYLKASNTRAFDWFGTSVAVSSNTVVVGAIGEASNATGVNGNQSDTSASNSGAAYVFVRNGSSWTQQAYLKASNPDGFVPGIFAGDYFGISVALSGDTVVIGANQESSNATSVNGDQSDNSAKNSGAAYVFVRNGTNWTQQAYLKASNSEADDFFGVSVTVSGDTVVVGAPGESSSATGVNGDQNDNSATNSGAAYVFVRDGTNWTQQAYLKASNTGGEHDSLFGDHFGRSVGISADTAVVGAYGEDSAATGVNGDETDNSAPVSGAVYVFTGWGAFRPLLAIQPDGSGGYFIRFNGTPGSAYRLQRAPSLSGPWTTIAPQTAPASGFVEFWDFFPPPGQAFYRTVQP